MADLIHIDLPPIHGQALPAHGRGHEILGRMFPAPARGKLNQLRRERHLFVEAGVDRVLDLPSNSTFQHRHAPP